jgi:hypothetical protein
MKNILLISISISLTITSYAQERYDSIRMTVSYSTNKEIRNILDFEEIDYQYITFTGKQLNGSVSFPILGLDKSIKFH